MNSNNINNDINRFDGRYLKCVVTKYTGSVQHLANSGSLIVLQPSNKKNRNYVYLGNEFLASGYGLSTEAKQIKAEEIIESYDRDIKNLQDSILKEEDQRKINDEDIINDLHSNYVKIKGGPIENTIVNINNISIPTRDVILYGEEAQYNDISIEDIKIIVNDNYVAENGEISVPIGTSIDNITVEITIQDNDSGGLDFLKVLHDFNDGTYVGNEGVIVEYDYDADTTILDTTGSTAAYKLHKYYYTRLFSKNELIIDKRKENVIKSMYIGVKETPQANYKEYPGLAKKGYHILSTGNSIKSHQKNLNIHLNINPIYVVRWDYDAINIQSGFTDSSQILFNNTKYTDLLINISSGKSDGMNMYIALPSNYTLQQVFLTNNRENYNITGAVYLIRQSVYFNCSTSLSNLDINNEYYLKHNIYQINIGENSSLTADISKVLLKIYNNDTTNNALKLTDTEIAKINNIVDDPIPINDELFNSLYWINVEGLSKEDLTKRLDTVRANGVVK